MQNHARYTIGLDYGSLSCRGLLVNIADGKVMEEAIMAYPHGVMDRALPDGTLLQGEWCLQHPEDYTLALETVVQQLMQKSGVKKEQVTGIGIDCTACTPLPVDEHFRPLCLDPKWASHPHAWVKMWKHHGAAAQAEDINRVCHERAKKYLSWYGGRINSECMLAKVMQVLDEDRPAYEATAAFMEMADYLTSLLVGKPAFSTSMASAKAFWGIKEGYGDGEFYAALRPELRNLPKKLMEHYPHRTVARPGECVGGLCGEMAEKLGLCPGTSVSAAQMDAYTPMLGLGIAKEGKLMMVMGTSTGIMLLSREPKAVEGVTTCLPETYYPGFWGYSAGQASVGDGFQWFSENCVPEAYQQEARERKMHIQQLLTEKAEKLGIGESGVMALDWINGNKSVLGNSRLSGAFIGLSLTTRPEHLYRSLLEATAFGARIVVEAFRKAGVAVDEIHACGGIAGKNPLMMQIYADILGVPLHASRLTQASALGMAIYAAAAAGAHENIFAAVEKMSDRGSIVYHPIKENQAKYEALYQEYVLLHDYFGRGENPVMEKLYALKKREE